VPLLSFMNDLRRYTKLAEECLQKAISSASAEMAEEWLRMAASWLAMSNFRERILARGFGRDHSLRLVREQSGLARNIRPVR